MCNRFDSSNLLAILHLRITPLKHHPHHRNHHKAKHASLRTNHPSGKPSRPMKRRLQQMPRKNRPAIRHRIKKRLSPIPRRMKSHRKPQAPGAPQRQAKEKSNHPRRQQSRSTALPRFRHVDQAKHTREHHRRRPEPDHPRQRKLRITAQQKFFITTPPAEKIHAQKTANFTTRDSMQRQVSHRSNTRSPYKIASSSVMLRKSPHRAHPKQFSERQPHRQTITHPTAAVPFKPAPAPEAPPPAALQTPPASSTTIRSRRDSKTQPTG